MAAACIGLVPRRASYNWAGARRTCSRALQRTVLADGGAERFAAKRPDLAALAASVSAQSARR